MRGVFCLLVSIASCRKFRRGLNSGSLSGITSERAKSAKGVRYRKAFEKVRKKENTLMITR